MNARSLLLLLSALFLPCCNLVTVKTPAGDRPASLSAEAIEGKWRGPGNISGSIKIKDAEKSIVEIQTTSEDGKVEKAEYEIRELGDRLVATLRDDDKQDRWFFRIAVGEECLSFFAPDYARIKAAVESGKIAGTIIKPQKEQDEIGWESVKLERFGLEEAEKAGGVLACFDPDPTGVLIREAKPSKKGKSRK